MGAPAAGVFVCEALPINLSLASFAEWKNGIQRFGFGWCSASVEIAVRRRVFQERLNLHREVEVQPAGWQKQHRRMRRPNRISEASANSRIRIPL
jgi:hypothetical protein